MRKRMKISRKKSGKLFTRTAKKINKRNGATNVMRGGIRL